MTFNNLKFFHRMFLFRKKFLIIKLLEEKENNRQLKRRLIRNVSLMIYTQTSHSWCRERRRERERHHFVLGIVQPNSINIYAHTQALRACQRINEHNALISFHIHTERSGEWRPPERDVFLKFIFYFECRCLPFILLLLIHFVFSRIFLEHIV